MAKNDKDQLGVAKRFEESRSHLTAAAYRMLGSRSEADDAVQETWLRLSRTDTRDIENLAGWLTTVVARVCLDLLRSRKARHEEPLPPPFSPEILAHGGGSDPEQETLLTDSVGHAMLTVMGTLSPAERIAFVLHDLFDLSFDTIAPIVERTPTAARQLASRARRRVKETTSLGIARTHPNEQRELVAAFRAAARGGDFSALLTVLDPNVILRADAAAVRLGASPEVRGATAVAKIYFGRAQAAEPAIIDGAAGLVWAPDGPPRVVFHFTIAGGVIAAIDLIADPERLAKLGLVIAED